MNSAVASDFRSTDQINNLIYGQSSVECTETPVDSTSANRSGPFTAGRVYIVYGLTSPSDFSGVAIKCLAGDSSVTVASKKGKVIPAGQQDFVIFKGTNLYLSCETASGSAQYDVCAKN